MYRKICIGIPFLLIGCQPTFTAEVAGYVLDIETEAGIEGATVRFFDKEPSTANDSPFLSETATSPLDGDAGYFSKTIGWQDLLANFGEDGDYRDLYFGISHPEYQSEVFYTKGIYSGSMNVVPSMRLSSLRRSVSELQGSVRTQNGGQNGVRVTLSLEEDGEIYDVQYTEPLNGENGIFRFSNIEWLDQDNTGNVVAYVHVEDPNYSDSIPSVITQTLNEENSFYTLSPFEVRKERPDIFTANIFGSAYFSYQTVQGNFTELPIEGITLSLEWNYDDTNETDPQIAYVRTDSQGAFEIQIAWTDTIPDPEDGIPQGEDQIPVRIQFPSNSEGLTFDLSQYSGEYTIRSWLENQLPPAIEAIQSQ